MEGFESKQYRDDLAKGLKEIRKTNPEAAIDVLKMAKETENYQEAKKIKIENFKKEKIPLEMYQISGLEEDKAKTEHSLERYIRDRAQDGAIKKKVNIPIFLTEGVLLAETKEKRISIIMESMFSVDEIEQDLAWRMLGIISTEERREIFKQAYTYGLTRLEDKDPKVQLAATRFYPYGNKLEQQGILPPALIISNVDALIRTRDPKDLITALQMTPSVQDKMALPIWDRCIRDSNIDVARATVKFVIDSGTIPYQVQMLFMAIMLDTDDIKKIKEVAKKCRFLKIDDRGLTVFRQFFANVNASLMSGSAKPGIWSRENYYDEKEVLAKKSHFDDSGKQLVGVVLNKIKKSLYGLDYEVLETAAETSSYILEYINADERRAVQNKILSIVEESFKNPDVEVQKFAARMVRYIPEKNRKTFVNKLLDDSYEQNIKYQQVINGKKFNEEDGNAENINKAIKDLNEKIKITTELLAYLPQKEKSEYFQKAIDKGFSKQLIESSLYDKSDINERDFKRIKFPKSGLETKLIGGKLKNKTIIREMTPRTFLFWKKLFEDYKLWELGGLNYVPVEPIQSYKLNKEGMVEVYSGVLDLNLEQWFGKTDKFKAEIEEQVNKIKETLKSLRMEHGHQHLRNFCLRFFRDKNGNPDLNKVPNVYLIDFDRATF